MQTAGTIVIAIGVAIALVGEVMLLAVAFRKSVAWLMICLFVPVVGKLIFVALHWREGRKPLLIQVAGFVILLLGIYVHNGLSFTSH